MRKLAMAIILGLGLTLVPLQTTTEPAGSQTQGWSLSPADEAAFVASLNAVRAANGLQPLQVNGNMTAAARNWAGWMASNGVLQHAGDIVTGAPGNWTKVGENVGRGGGVQSVFDAFMASPSHRANVLDPSYTQVGVGVVWTTDGLMYTTHRFAAAGAAPPPPPPAPTATPVPPSPTPVPPTPTPVATPQPAPGSGGTTPAAPTPTTTSSGPTAGTPAPSDLAFAEDLSGPAEPVPTGGSAGDRAGGPSAGAIGGDGTDEGGGDTAAPTPPPAEPARVAAVLELLLTEPA